MKQMKMLAKKAGEVIVMEGKAFVKSEDAMGAVEIILIIVVLVSLVLIFRTQVTKLISNAFKKIKEGEEEIDNDNSIDGGY